ncbi:Uncharacterised protein [Mycobacteroides abscessus subsp. abscessus]|nr:Uncharacterised protein [Mycobacteroides abscessus subsp. abscessus]
MSVCVGSDVDVLVAVGEVVAGVRGGVGVEGDHEFGELISQGGVGGGASGEFEGEGFGIRPQRRVEHRQLVGDDFDAGQPDAAVEECGGGVGEVGEVGAEDGVAARQ